MFRRYPLGTMSLRIESAHVKRYRQIAMLIGRATGGGTWCGRRAWTPAG